MRQRNWRLVVVGLVLFAGAIAFFFYAQAAMAPHSNDPTEMMKTVGQVSGGVGGLSVVMVLFGLIGKRA